MKTAMYLFSAILLGCIMASCKENNTIKPSSLSSLNVTNVVIGGTTLILNTSTLTVSNNNFAQFALNAGQSQVELGTPAVPATGTTPAIPAVTYYNQVIPTSSGSYYSLFLSGTSPSSVDGTLIKENYKNYTDSLCGVRFINLSPGSNPVSVNIVGQGDGSEVQTLAYKAYSDFKQYTAKAANKTYVFEFRDVITGNLIKSYTLATPFFNNVTLALTGLPGANNVLLVKDY